MIPKINSKKYFLSSLTFLCCAALITNFVGFSNLKDSVIPNNHGQAKMEPETINKGSIERIAFQNINNRVFLLEPFRDVQSGDLYVLTEVDNKFRASLMKCILCKNKYSFYDDPEECTELKIESVHDLEGHSKAPLVMKFFHCLIPSHVEAKDYPLSTLKIDKEYGRLVRISDINHKEGNNTLITMCAGPQYGKNKKAVNLAE
jgi:hypothetical protein